MTPANDLPALPEPDVVDNYGMERGTLEDALTPPRYLWTAKTMRAFALATRAERDSEIERWNGLWDNVAQDVPNLRSDNKPLAIAASWELLKQRAEAAEKTANACLAEFQVIHAERDTLHTQVAELQERLMVMCVAQLREGEPVAWGVLATFGPKPSLQFPLFSDKFQAEQMATGYRRDGVGAVSVVGLCYTIINDKQFRPSPDPPAPAPLAAQGVEGEPR